MPPKGLSLPEPLAERVRAGLPEIELEGLPRSGPALEPGRPLLLLDGDGQALATGLSDPENGVIRILSRDCRAIDRSFAAQRVQDALALRHAMGLGGGDRGDAAYRLFNGAGDGVSGFAADVFGHYVVLYAYGRGLVPFARVLAECILEEIGCRGVVLKVRPRGGTRPGKVKQEILGEAPPEKLIVREHDVPYEVHLLSGINVGLFTDLREQRRGLGRFCGGRRVLNTFAYTCSLSVAAARAGATAVTSVDLSSGVLKWARANFELAGLDPEEERFRFEASDVFRFLERERAAATRYDTVILDPPTFSAARASGWSMKNDYPALIDAAAALLDEAKPGILWVSSNTHRGRRLQEQITCGLAHGGWRGQVLEISGLPPDYPTLLEHPRGRYLEVWILRVER